MRVLSLFLQDSLTAEARRRREVADKIEADRTEKIWPTDFLIHISALRLGVSAVNNLIPSARFAQK
jgi:hypothetical protein